VGLGVFEVGMGGSDATNLIGGDVAIVTPIAMDHVAELGPTLADIAGEKAGCILKAGRSAHPAGRRRRRRGSAAAPGRSAGDLRWEALRGRSRNGCSPSAATFRLRGCSRPTTTFYLPLFGDCAVAAAAGVVAFEAPPATRSTRTRAAPWPRERVRPGRWRLVGTNCRSCSTAWQPFRPAPRWLADALRASFPVGATASFSRISANKDAAGILARCAGRVPIWLARNDSVRSADPTTSAAAGRGGRPRGSVAEAIDAARADAGPADVSS
jgi:dihydrofolate synthase/folylpolyglutamate synthase